MAEAPRSEGEQVYTFPDEEEVVKTVDAAEAEAEAEDDIDIAVVDDTPEPDRGHKPGVSKDIGDVTDDELATYSGNVQKRIRELSFARHDERRAKEAALREQQELQRVAQAVFDENKRLKEYVHKGEQVYAGTAKSAAENRLEMAKKKYKEAHEAFDADALIEAQTELTYANLELNAAKNFRPTPLQESPEQVYTPKQVPDPDERAVRWQQRNKWFGSDNRMTALALAVHQELVDSGLDPRSEEYYKRIDASVRETFPRKFEDAQAGASRKSASVVAPTARTGSTRKVTLTQTQVGLAKKLGVSLADYARHAALLENNDGR